MSKGTARVLILDDEKDWCEILKFRLERCLYNVSVAHNSESALQLFHNQTFDCLLLDANLKGSKDGVQFLKDLKQYSFEDATKQAEIEKLQVFVVTAGDSLYQEPFKEMGINVFFSKPVDTDKLQACIDKIVDKPAE